MKLMLRIAVVAKILAKTNVMTLTKTITLKEDDYDETRASSG